MKKFVVAAVGFVAMGSSAMAGELLTTTQLDEVTAARWGGFQFANAEAFQVNSNRTRQNAFAFSEADGGCIVAICGHGSGNAFSAASASNWNATAQSNSNAAVNID